MRKAGYPRPTCEECGLVRLTEENREVWNVFQDYTGVVFNLYGNGSWSINIPGVEYVGERFVIGADALVDGLLILAKVLFKPKAKEGQDGN